jgi:hypothetical protein
MDIIRKRRWRDAAPEHILAAENLSHVFSWDSLDCRCWPSLPVDADEPITVGRRIKTTDTPKRIEQFEEVANCHKASRIRLVAHTNHGGLSF